MSTTLTNPGETHTAPPPPPNLPASFTSEQRLSFLYTFLNPDIDHFQLAERFDLRLGQLCAYINSGEFQQRLADQTSISEMRAQACAKMAQPKAVAALEYILASYADAERNELVDDDKHPRPKLRALRQRHRESARRAARLILKLTGTIPSHLRAAKPTRDSETADTATDRERSSHTRARTAQTTALAIAQMEPTAQAVECAHEAPPPHEAHLPTEPPAVLQREHAALARRAQSIVQAIETESSQTPTAQAVELSTPIEPSTSCTPDARKTVDRIFPLARRTRDAQRREAALSALQPAGP